MSDAPPPSGHIKVSRKVFDADHGDPLWMEDREFSRWEAWVYLIQLAAWKPSRYRTAGGVIELDRGEFVASRRHLAKRWNWTEKRARGFLAFLQKGARIRAQREAQAGTVYLITKYDAYQTTPSKEGPAKGPAEGHPGAQPGPKIEAVKAVSTSGTPRRPRKTADADASGPSNIEAFPKAVCDAAHERWTAKFGAMEYPRFRKALLPLFQAIPRCYTAEQMVAGVDAYHDGMTADKHAFRGKWTINRFAAELHEWVRLGGMEIVDEWGMPTERGRMAGVFAA